MRDETLIEPFAAPEIYVDGFDHTVSNGMMMAAGYRVMNAEKIVVVRLVLKVENVPTAIADAKAAMNAPIATRPEQRASRH